MRQPFDGVNDDQPNSADLHAPLSGYLRVWIRYDPSPSVDAMAASLSRVNCGPCRALPRSLIPERLRAACAFGGRCEDRRSRAEVSIQGRSIPQDAANFDPASAPGFDNRYCLP